jgi:hypothetical protein
MKDLIIIVSFLMAVAAGLVAVLSKNQHRRTSSLTIGFIFITAFLLIFLNRGITIKGSELIQKSTCIISFAMAVTGGLAAIFHEDRDRQFVSGAVGFVSLIVSLLLLW